MIAMDSGMLYTEIGRMAYAMAKAKGDVMEKELENVFNFIDEEIKNTGSNAPLLLGEEFTKLRKMHVSARDAFSMFTSFIEHHGNSLQRNIKNTCIKLAIKIASSDEGIDETEVALINKLRKKLELN